MTANILNYSILSRILDKIQKKTPPKTMGGAHLGDRLSQIFFNSFDYFVDRDTKEIK